MAAVLSELTDVLVEQVDSIHEHLLLTASRKEREAARMVEEVRNNMNISSSE